MTLAQTVRSFWFGGPLSPYETMCLTSFVDHGHGFELYAYDRALSVPPGVVLRDAAEILPADSVYLYTGGPGAGSVAGFANLFRYVLLQRFGGWWVDTDVVCLSPHLPDDGRFLAWEEPAPSLVGNAVMRLPADDPLLAHLLADLTLFRGDAPWGTAGPKLVTRAVKQMGIEAEIRDHAVAYPWHFRHTFDVFDPARTEAIRTATQGALFQHLWHENFRRCGVLKTVRPPAGSWMDRLCHRHNVTFPADPSQDPVALRRVFTTYERGAAMDELQAERDWLAGGVEAADAREAGLRAETERLSSVAANLSREAAALREGITERDHRLAAAATRLEATRLQLRHLQARAAQLRDLLSLLRKSRTRRLASRLLPYRRKVGRVLWRLGYRRG